MPNYRLSKIYRVRPIVDYDIGDEYFGATTHRWLCDRMAGHRCDYKRKRGCKTEYLFDKYGVENCIIELVLEYPCDTKQELAKKEGEYVRFNLCVNLNIPDRTEAEYNKMYFKERITPEKKQQYYIASMLKQGRKPMTGRGCRTDLNDHEDD